jgi:DNA-binding transcriptional ArsR family regulator
LTCPAPYITMRLLNRTAMEQIASKRLDDTFLALADPTRRAILARLALGEASVTELAEPFAISQPAISKHLRMLERAGLISVGQDAQRRPRRLEGKPLAEASDWLEQYRTIWEANFARLDGLLAEMQRTSSKSKRARRLVKRQEDINECQQEGKG